MVVLTGFVSINLQDATTKIDLIIAATAPLWGEENIAVLYYLEVILRRISLWN